MLDCRDWQFMAHGSFNLGTKLHPQSWKAFYLLDALQLQVKALTDLHHTGFRHVVMGAKGQRSALHIRHLFQTSGTPISQLGNAHLPPESPHPTKLFLPAELSPGAVCGLSSTSPDKRGRPLLLGNRCLTKRIIFWGPNHHHFGGALTPFYEDDSFPEP